jgi:hypothetical protein
LLLKFIGSNFVLKLNMNININYPETNNELSTLLSQTLTAIGAKFKAVLKELINKVKN